MVPSMMMESPVKRGSQVQRSPTHETRCLIQPRLQPQPHLPRIAVTSSIISESISDRQGEQKVEQEKAVRGEGDTTSFSKSANTIGTKNTQTYRTIPSQSFPTNVGNKQSPHEHGTVEGKAATQDKFHHRRNVSLLTKLQVATHLNGPAPKRHSESSNPTSYPPIRESTQNHTQSIPTHIHKKDPIFPLPPSTIKPNNSFLMTLPLQ